MWLAGDFVAAVLPEFVFERRPLGHHVVPDRLLVDGGGGDENILSRLPGEGRNVALHLVGGKDAELGDDIEMIVAKLAVGRVVHVADPRLNAGRQRYGGPAPIREPSPCGPL